jgi:hypothetical protein
MTDLVEAIFAVIARSAVDESRRVHSMQKRSLTVPPRGILTRVARRDHPQDSARARKSNGDARCACELEAHAPQRLKPL